MPIYEYKCLDCGEHLEKMQKISEETLKICEKCGGKLEKQWSRSGIQFKGAGWYVNDYADKKSGKSEKSEKSDNNSEKSSAGESTAKPETASKENTVSPVKESAPKKD